jgi:hypothetical protein
MKKYAAAVKDHIVKHKIAYIATVSSIAGAALIAVIIVLIVLANQIKIVYQPVNACDLLTQAKADQLLGTGAINGSAQKPVIGKINAASSCAYSDLNVDENSMVVAAVSVRSAINDQGIAQNQLDYVANKSKVTAQDVSGVGDSAYFNGGLGQLNVIDQGGKRLMIFSYGTGSTPQSNTLDDAIKFARLVLN